MDDFDDRTVSGRYDLMIVLHIGTNTKNVELASTQSVTASGTS